MTAEDERTRARDVLAEWFGGDYHLADRLVLHLHHAGLGVVPVDPADGLPLIDGQPAVQWAEDYAREILAEAGWWEDEDEDAPMESITPNPDYL